MWNQKGFAMRLRFVINIRKTTQGALARKLEVAESTFSQWMTGLTNSPNLHTIDALAKILKVKACWLTYGCAAHEPPEWHDFYKYIEKCAKVARRVKGEVDD